MFSDSRWGYTYVVSASLPDGGAPYARPMLSAHLPNRAACVDKRLIETLGLLPAGLLCVPTPPRSVFLWLILIIWWGKTVAAAWMCGDAKLFVSAWRWRPLSPQACPAQTFTSSARGGDFCRTEGETCVFLALVNHHFPEETIERMFLLPNGPRSDLQRSFGLRVAFKYQPVWSLTSTDSVVLLVEAFGFYRSQYWLILATNFTVSMRRIINLKQKKVQ